MDKRPGMESSFWMTIFEEARKLNASFGSNSPYLPEELQVRYPARLRERDISPDFSSLVGFAKIMNEAVNRQAITS